MYWGRMAEDRLQFDGVYWGRMAEDRLQLRHRL